MFSSKKFRCTTFAMTTLVFSSVALRAQMKAPEQASPSWLSPPAIDYKSPLRILRFGKPALPNDPLKRVAPASPTHGTLVYTPRIILNKEQPATYFIVLRDTLNNIGIQPPYAIYIAGTDDRVFDPHFSPDGSKLLIKNGRPETPFYGYTFSIWDFDKKSLINTTERLLFSELQWSPKGDSIAYIKGGVDEQGHETDDMTGTRYPLSLCVFNIEQQKSTTLVQEPEVTDFRWCTSGNILFSHKDKENFHSSIYEVNPQSKSLQSVIVDAYNPIPSPDNKWIVFLGWFPPLKKDTTNRAASRFGVGVYNRDSNTRYFLHSLAQWSEGSTRFPILFHWDQKSDGFWWIDSTYVKKQLQTTVNRINIGPTLSIDAENEVRNTLVATIPTIDATDTERSVSASPVRFVASTKDGQLLILDKSQFSGVDRSFYTEQKSLVALNVKDGTNQLLAEVENKWGSVLGWDWREQLP